MYGIPSPPLGPTDTSAVASWTKSQIKKIAPVKSEKNDKACASGTAAKLHERP
jgi:hypothetical protein